MVSNALTLISTTGERRLGQSLSNHRLKVWKPCASKVHIAVQQIKIATKMLILNSASYLIFLRARMTSQWSQMMNRAVNLTTREE